MGYYRGGDYYRGGGYYRAGGIFGDIGRAISGTVGGALKGLITGGPIGGIVGAVKGAAGATHANVAAAAGRPDVDTPSAYTPAMRAAHNRVLMRQHATVAAAAVASTQAAGARNGGGGGRRSMRVTNVKALNRATRRIKGFEKTAKRSLSVLGLHVVRHVNKPAGRGRR